MHRYLLAQGQRRVLGIQDPVSVYRGEIPTEPGTTPEPLAPSEPTPPAQQFTGTLTASELDELSPWLLAVTLGSTGNTDLAAGYLACDVVKIHDDDDSHELSLVWNESEATANRTLNLVMGGADRTFIPPNTITKTGNHTFGASDYTIFCNALGASFTITAFVASSNPGRIGHIKKIDSSANIITLDGNGADLIENEASITLTEEGESVTFQSDGTKLWII